MLLYFSLTGAQPKLMLHPGNRAPKMNISDAMKPLALTSIVGVKFTLRYRVSKTAMLQSKVLRRRYRELRKSH